MKTRSRLQRTRTITIILIVGICLFGLFSTLQVDAKSPDVKAVKADGADCPVIGGCPYLKDQHVTVYGAHNAQATGCPLKEKCPIYQAAHNSDKAGKIDWTNIGDCPAAEQCSYLKQIREQGGNLQQVLKEHPERANPLRCPVAGNCPFLKEASDSAHPRNCPLQDKCPYFQEVKDGKLDNVNWSKATGCPQLDACPYVKDLQSKNVDLNEHFKTNDWDSMLAQCPYLAISPKEGHHTGTPPPAHAHMGKAHAHDFSGDISKCPHFAKGKVVNKDKMVKSPHTGAKGDISNCPYFADHGVGRGNYLKKKAVANDPEPEAVLEASYEAAINSCPVIQNLNQAKMARKLNQSNFMQRLFAFVFPGDAAVNSLLATLYISLFPNLILAFVPADIDLESLNTLVAFAVGGLLGDVFLHLLPHSFLGEHTDDKIHYVLVDNKKNVVIGTALFIGFAIFFVIDKAMRVMGAEGHSHDHGHGHSHAHVDENEEDEASATATGSTVVGGHELRQRKSTSGTPSKQAITNGTTEPEKEEKRKPSTSIKMSAYLNLIADASHNFTDGLAISASFYSSPAIGATTAVAVLLHEVPHEVGDYAILVQSGFSKTKAMASQFLTAGGAFLGTFAGIAIQQWGASAENAAGGPTPGMFGTSVKGGDLVIPFTAGGFLYIATVAVVPELLGAKSKGSKAKDAFQAIKEMVAMAVGIGLMLTIAWNE